MSRAKRLTPFHFHLSASFFLRAELFSAAGWRCLVQACASNTVQVFGTVLFEFLFYQFVVSLYHFIVGVSTEPSTPLLVHIFPY